MGKAQVKARRDLAASLRRERMEILGTQYVRSRRNGPEWEFERFAINSGWSFTKRGWPDFICTRPDGSIACVEVKPVGKKLKAAQRSVMEILSCAGIECYRWDPVNGFTEWRQ